MKTRRPASRKRDDERNGFDRSSRAMGSGIFTDMAWREIGCSLNLSGREAEIVRHLFDDHTESAIAARLGISVHTIHTHLYRLHRKLGVVDRVQLVLRITSEFLALTVSGVNPLPPICANRISGRCPLRAL